MKDPIHGGWYLKRGRVSAPSAVYDGETHGHVNLRTISIGWEKEDRIRKALL